MKTIDISLKLLSDVVWERILETSAVRLQAYRAAFFGHMAGLDALRAQADYNTGSISAAAAWQHYALAAYFTPKKLLEVGTFIGRSTLALAMGLDAAGAPGEIHSCDKSNAITLPALTETRIVQYPRQSSTDMFRQLRSAQPEAKFDFIHIDGRLQPDDFALLAALLAPDAIVAIDDFEGTEKGVVNASALKAGNLLPAHTVVYPCRAELLRSYGFADDSTLALMIPSALLRLTAQ